MESSINYYKCDCLKTTSSDHQFVTGVVLFVILSYTFRSGLYEGNQLHYNYVSDSFQFGHYFVNSQADDSISI